MAENNQQLQIELKPEVAEGTYSNLAILTHSSSEFVADFVQMMPGMQKAQVRSRIIMDNVQKYEKQFGPIRLTQVQQSNEGKTIAPFTIKQGEA